jgi:asparagine synthase (glutamine-hydrolysing)
VASTLGILGSAPQGARSKMLKAAEALSARGDGALFTSLLSHWRSPSALLPLAEEPPTLLSTRGWPDLPDVEHRLMLLDLAMYLPDDVLVKVDRASMSVGLEARAPLLDHRVVELAWRLPLEWKIRGRSRKRVLKLLLKRRLPDRLVDRAKMGFGVPIGEWLRGPLRSWAEGLLDAHLLESVGLDVGPARETWAEHLSGRKDAPYPLWNVLMLSAWARDSG